MERNITKTFGPQRIYDPENVDEKLNDEQIRYLFYSLHEMIKELSVEIQRIKTSSLRDKQDQWRMISEICERTK